MNRFTRTAVIAALGLLMYAAGVLTLKAGNTSITPPAPPPPGATVKFVGLESVVVNEEHVLRVQASVPKAVRIHFEVIDGDAVFTGRDMRQTDRDGKAERGLLAKTAGKIVVRTWCDTAGCEDVMTLQAVAP